MKLSPEPLISSTTIQARVGELAEEIARDYAGRVPVFVGVLKGALHLTSDLARRMPAPIGIEFVRASSYSGTESRGEVDLHPAILECLTGRELVVIEDIIDTGRTCATLLQHLRTFAPASIRLCTLLDKPSRRVIEVPIDYVGFTIDDHFVVGYGLDYEEQYRELSAIHVLI